VSASSALPSTTLAPSGRFETLRGRTSTDVCGLALPVEPPVRGMYPVPPLTKNSGHVSGFYETAAVSDLTFNGGQGICGVDLPNGAVAKW
jgi:hypothetical protein